jgi:hypothetical protein
VVRARSTRIGLLTYLGVVLLAGSPIAVGYGSNMIRNDHLEGIVPMGFGIALAIAGAFAVLNGARRGASEVDAGRNGLIYLR